MLAVSVHSWASGDSQEYTVLGVISEFLQGCLMCPQPGRLELAVPVGILGSGERRREGVRSDSWQPASAKVKTREETTSAVKSNGYPGWPY